MELMKEQMARVNYCDDEIYVMVEVYHDVHVVNAYVNDDIWIYYFWVSV